MNAQVSLHDLLDASTGIVCAVGAGGKKSVLGWLAAHHPGRVALTATVVTTHFPESLGFAIAIDEPERLAGRIAALGTAGSVAYACPSGKPGRHAGVPGEVIERIHEAQAFAATYVKADGARMRWVKAPAADEPVLPATCRSVIAVLSARALGEPFDARVAHRLDEVARITGLTPGEQITPLHLGQLIAHPDGPGRAGDGRRVVPLINMVDDSARESLAREAALAALELNPAIPHVVLTSLRNARDPLVAVVRR